MAETWLAKIKALETHIAAFQKTMAQTRAETDTWRRLREELARIVPRPKGDLETAPPGPSLRHFGQKYGPSSRRIAPRTQSWARGCIPRIRNRRQSAMSRSVRGRGGGGRSVGRRRAGPRSVGSPQLPSFAFVWTLWELKRKMI